VNVTGSPQLIRERSFIVSHWWLCMYRRHEWPHHVTWKPLHLTHHSYNNKTKTEILYRYCSWSHKIRIKLQDITWKIWHIQIVSDRDFTQHSTDLKFHLEELCFSSYPLEPHYLHPQVCLQIFWMKCFFTEHEASQYYCWILQPCYYIQTM
jgi:hypothetical protein